METMNTLKQMLRLNEIHKIEQTNIIIGLFNFRTGDVDRVSFDVDYVAKFPYGSYADKDDFPSQDVWVYGTITYDSHPYKTKNKLTYTDSKELEKLFEPLKNSTLTDNDAVRLYCC